MDYNALYKTYKNNDNDNFKSDARALLNKLKLINKEDYIEEKKKALVVGDSSVNKWRNDFILDIHILFIEPNLSLSSNGAINFKDTTVTLANTKYTKEYEKAIKDEMIAENNKESKVIQANAKASRQAQDNRRGFTWMGRDSYSVSSNAPSGWKATGTRFGRPTHIITHPNLGVPGHIKTIENQY